MNKETETSRNFIEEEIELDLANDRFDSPIHTRFPPEPNGYLHIGHAKAICLNFGIAAKYNGRTNLRFDDTNPSTEETRYVDAIKDDIKWLGFDWDDREYYASDYFDQFYGYAVTLIKKGLAYVDDSSAEEMALSRGVPTSPGKESPYRDRSVNENIELFESMRRGEFADGDKVLRAKIDMSSPNMHMRDPVIYRIKKEQHHRTKDAWCIYPMYDFAHGQSDSLEKITHSLCSLEFRHHRPLYDWFIENLEIFPSRQIEFARMNVAYMITSKRKLAKLVEQGLVTGWDDPRMSTISGMRRRGYPSAAIRNFCDKVGIAKRDNLIDMALLESCVREELNQSAARVMVVSDPIKLTITNLPEGHQEHLLIENNPEDEKSGYRKVLFDRHLYIDRGDFMIDPPKKYFRLGPGRNVRLKGAYIVTCHDYRLNDDTGAVEEVFCTYYENSKSGQDVSGVKSKGVLHWVSVAHSVDLAMNEFDRLFIDPTPDGHEDRDFLEFYNETSLKVIEQAKAEKSLESAGPGDQFQFMRKGYYIMDKDSTASKLICNRTVALRDSWKKLQQNV